MNRKVNLRFNELLFALALLSYISAAVGEDLSKEELDAWFEDDARSDPFSTADVNEGELEFLTTPPDKPTLYSANQLTIHATSLQDGWVNMYQCYENLDAVKDAQVQGQQRQHERDETDPLPDRQLRYLVSRRY